MCEVCVSPSQDSVHVLVVDDERDLVVLMTIVNENRGRRVTGVTNVEDALAVVDSDAPDIVLLDLAMPGGNGEELLDMLAERDVPPPPVLVLTAAEEERVVRLAERHGIEWIRKPYTMERVEERIQALLADPAGD